MIGFVKEIREEIRKKGFNKEHYVIIRAEIWYGSMIIRADIKGTVSRD